MNTSDTDMLRRDRAANKFAADLLMPKEKFIEVEGDYPVT